MNVELTNQETLITTARLEERKLAGGFHIVNMKDISIFNQVTIKGLTAEYGGCMLIRLDQNFRPQLYNQKYYNLTNVKLTDCVANVDGGGLQLENIRKLRLAGNSVIQNNEADQRGGGINYICEDLALDCNLQLDSV